MAAPVNVPIPQNKIEECFVWRDWFQKLSNKVFGSIANQDANAVNITGGTISGIALTGDTIDSSALGATTPSSGRFTSLAIPGVTDGQIPIGRTSDSKLIPALLTAGGGITITNGPSAVTIASTLSGAHIEAYDLSVSIPLSATPILLAPASTSAGAIGITYNSTTGVFTFTNAGSYSLALVVSAIASAAGQALYLYQELWNGSAWVANPNSGKYLTLLNNQVTQIVSAQAVYRAAGSQVRYWIYSNSNKVALQTFTLPGIASTVYTPAIRIQFAS